MRKLTESMETVLEYVATGVAPVDMAQEGSRSYRVSFQGLCRRGLVELHSDGANLTEEGSAYWAKKTSTPASISVPASVLEPLDTETAGITEEALVVLVSGVRVRSTAGGVLGQVLEVGMRAGVAVVAVAFGALLVWLAAVELVLA